MMQFAGNKIIAAIESYVLFKMVEIFKTPQEVQDQKKETSTRYTLCRPVSSILMFF